MRSSAHLFVSNIVIVSLLPVNDFNYSALALFTIWSIGMDIDHIVYLVCKHKTFSLESWTKYCNGWRKNMQANLYIFHSPEFFLIIFFLCFMYRSFAVLLTAGLVHLAMDIIEHNQHHRNFSFLKKWSVIYTLAKAAD